MAWYVAAVAVIVLLALYAGWTARRLDRLHARVDAAAAGLDGQLKLRATAAARLADSPDVPKPVVQKIAPAALVAAEAHGVGHDREIVENRLSRALQDTAHLLEPAQPDVGLLLDAATRAGFARRFHNDAVRDALVVRQRRIVRLLHLAGRATQPTYFEVDDSPVVIEAVTPASAPYD